MGIKQNKIGHHTEQEVASFFKEHRYWAFVIPKGINGQPFDIIARHANDTYFIDAKHLENETFPFERIEPNQITSMAYAHQVADIKDNMGFVIQHKEKFYFLSYILYLELKNKGKKGVKLKDLIDLEAFIDGSENIK